MKRIVAGAFAATLVALAASAASADTSVIDLPPNYVDGNCIFNTSCGPAFGYTNPFAAQAFSVAGPATLTGGSFTVYTNSTSQPTAVNWRLHADSSGAPGALIASGSSTISSRDKIGEQYGYDLTRQGFALPGLSIGAGAYHFGMQAVSSDFAVYLAYAAGTGAYQSNDGGANWASRYQSGDAISMSLTSGAGAVPEPATWAMMIGGFGLAGAGLRRRKPVFA